MAFEQCWRWFGPADPVTLAEIRQTGAKGIVTALHQVPIGEPWPVDQIMERKKMIEAAGLTWTVAESVPVHEDIKKGMHNFQSYIENYKQTIRNLGQCRVGTICYNFMPVLDWSRTDLNVVFKDGSVTTGFQSKVFAAFDIFILQRTDAATNYNSAQIQAAKLYYDTLSESQKEKLVQTVLLGHPGSLHTYTLNELKTALGEYHHISADTLRQNLFNFIKEIIPVAEKAGVLMAIHPDDPPWSLLGLPRIVSTKSDLEQILGVVDSAANGLTLCTGSLGASVENDLVDIAHSFASRINFIHLRNLKRNPGGDFTEDYHLNGDLDMYSIIKVLLLEQQRRLQEGLKNVNLPMRPDHGNLTLGDRDKKGIYPGYSLFGRMRGLAELRGLELGIVHSLGLENQIL